MEKKQFESIKTKLETVIKDCQDNFDKLIIEDSLIKITVGELIQLKNFSINELSRQTRILQNDLYHLIGMGNLSASQSAVLVKLIQKYSSYRPDIHALSSWSGNILELPKIPRRVKHRLKEFEIELVNGRAGEIEVEFDVEIESPSENLADIDSSDIGVFDGKNIKLTRNQARAFSERISNLGCFNIKSADTMYKAIMEGKLFGGIQWMKKDAYFLGCPTTPTTRINVANIFNS